MQFRYDMASIQPVARLRSFREMLANAIDRPQGAFAYDFGAEDFRAKVHGRRVGKMALAATETSSHSMVLSANAARCANEEVFVVGFNRGSRLESIQDGRETRLDTGDAAFLCQTRPYRSMSGDVGQRVYLQVTRRDLEERFGAVDDLTATTFSAKLSAQRLVSNYFIALGRTFESLDETRFVHLIGQGLDLLAFAIADQNGGRLANTTTHRSALVFRLKSFLLMRLADSELSLAEAATTFGVTPRYINKLLSTENTSFGRFVLERRLQACRRDLADPRQVGTPVIDVAFRWGFNDAAHFSRSFKARFGMPPRDYRLDKPNLLGAPPTFEWRPDGPEPRRDRAFARPR